MPGMKCVPWFWKVGNQKREVKNQTRDHLSQNIQDESHVQNEIKSKIVMFPQVGDWLRALTWPDSKSGPLYINHFLFGTVYLRKQS